MTEQFSLKNAQRLPGAKVILSPLALVILAACGGGGGSNVSTTFTRSGSVVKGPLKDALAFLDYDGDGVQDAGEPSVRTGADGSYSLTGATGNENATLVAITDETTVDTSSGTVLDGVTLSAPATASVVSMASTLMVEANLTEAQVQDALGITADVDLLSFNPFAAGADATIAATVEKTSQQVSSVVTSMTAAAKASGVSATDAFAESIKAVTEVVQAKVTAREAEVAAGRDPDLAAAAIDLTDSAQITAVADKVATAVATKAATDATIDSTAFNNMKTTVVTAVKNVNDVIDTSIDATNFSSDAAKQIYSVSQVLVDQVADAVAKEKAVKGTGADTVTFKDAAVAAAAKNNPAPTDVDLSVAGTTLAEGAAVSVSEGTGSLAIATISATDLKADSSAETSFTYSLGGDDASSFTITDGVLYLNAQPDYETKSSYSISIAAKDSEGKSFAESFTVNITDVDEATFGANFQVNSGSENEAKFTDYVKGAVSTQPSIADVDFNLTGGVADFGTLTVDVTNLSAVIAGTSTQAPRVSFKLAKLPDVSGGAVTKSISLTVVDGSDASRDEATERTFTVNFDVEMKEVGGNFVLDPVAGGTVSYMGRGDASPFVVSGLDVAGSKTITIGSDNVVDVNLFALVDQAKDVLPQVANLLTTGDYHVTLTGLPLMDANTDEITSLVAKLKIEDRDHTPYIAELSTVSTTEDAQAAASGTIRAVDAEGDTITYGITSGTATSTEVAKVGTYGTLTINKTTGNYTYLVDQAAVNSLGATDVVSETFEVSASDGTTAGTQALKFSVTGVNDDPSATKIYNTSTGAEITAASVTENQAGAIIGRLKATDPEGVGVSYSLVNVNNAALFEIKSIDGVQVLKLKDSTTANYEANTSYSVTVQASDQVNTSNTAFTISVVDVNEAPILGQPGAAAVTENSGSSAVGALAASDPDRGQSLTFAIDASGVTTSSGSDILGGAYGTLTLNKTTGAYTYALNETLSAVNVLTTGQSLSEQFTVKVTDSDSTAPLSASRTLTVNIAGNNDTPTNVALSSSAIGENIAGVEIGTLSATDAEGDTVNFTLATTGDYQKFEITSDNKLKLKDSIAADYETQTSYDLTVNAGDGNSSSTQNFTVTVVDTAKEPNQFWVSTDAEDASTPGVDAVLTDYINGAQTGTTTNVDLEKSNGVLDFGTVEIDANNAGLATAGSSNFKSPEISFYLDQVPTISGSQTLPITVTVTEGTDGTRASGERQAVVTFDLVLTGDGTTANLVAPSGGTATIAYYGSNASSPTTTTLTNDPNGTDPSVDNIIFVNGQNTGPNSTAVTLKILELMNKASSLSPTSILGEGANLHLKVEGLPLVDEAGTITSVEGKVVVKDLIAPTSTITRASYDSYTGQIIIQGTKFDELNVASDGTADVKAYLDWSKLKWDMNSSDSNEISFTQSDITSAIVTDAQTITITLEDDKEREIETGTGYGTTGGDDALDITAGFIRDKALNTSTNAADKANLNVVNLTELIRIQTDTSADITVTDYLDSQSSAAVTTSLDATVSNGVLNFGAVELDLVNIKKAAQNDSSYKSPELTLTVDKAALISGSKPVSVDFTIVDGSDSSRTVASERKVVISFDLALTGNGTEATFTAASQNATVAYYAAGASSATTATINNAGSNVFTINNGSNGLPSTISVRTLSLIEKANLVLPAATNVLSDGGDFYLTVTGLPIANETGPITSVEGALTIKDLVPPTSTITSAQYNHNSGGNGVITITGTKFDEIGVSDGGSIIDYLDFSKIKWDIEGDDSTTVVSFQKSDFSAAVVTNSTTLTLTLTSSAKADLEGEAGFAARAINDTYSTNPDTLDVTAGFISDIAGNKSVTDAKANAAITFADQTAPTLTSFTTTSPAGSYGVYISGKEGGQVNITANLSETVLKGSTFDVVLNTNDTVTLTAATTGTTLVGTYEVPANRTTSDLNVTSFGAGTVHDIYGNQLSSTSIPTGQNLADNAAIVIDTTPPATTISSVKYDGTGSTGKLIITGDKFLEIGVAASGDVKEYLDWGNLTWDIDATDTTTSPAKSDVQFAYTSDASTNDIASAIVTNDETLTITLTSVGTTKLTSADGFAAEGGYLSSGSITASGDAIDVTAGFIRDKALNPSSVDAASNATLTYENPSAPTVSSFNSGTANGAYGIVGGVGAQIEIVATMSEAVITSSKFTVTLSTDDTVELSYDTSDATGKTLKGTYTVGNLDTSSDLNVKSFNVGSVRDIYGTAMSSTDLPSSNLKDNKDIVIDTTAPSATITAIKYNNKGGVSEDQGIITFTGTNFDTLNVANGASVKEYLDWTKLKWNVDYGYTSAAEVSFTASDISTAVVTSPTVLTVTLTSTKKDSLEETEGFAAVKQTDSTSSVDRIEVTDGFIRDHAKNSSDTDGVNTGSDSAVTLTFQDTTAPTITSFASTSDDGSYGVGGQINITATASELLIPGSKVTVTLDTGSNETVELTSTSTAATLTNTLSGTYTVPSSVTSADLKVSSFTVSATDVYGNSMTSTTVPSGQNINNSSDIEIDTLAPTVTVSSAAYTSAGGTGTDLGIITLTGTNFDTLGQANGTDVKSQLSWSTTSGGTTTYNFNWDLEGDGGSTTVALVEADFTSVTVTNATTLTMILTSDGKTKLEGTSGFAAATPSTNQASSSNDVIAVSSGLFVDDAGNASTYSKSDIAISYADSTRPTVTSFTSTSADKSYGVGQTVNITANMSEDVLPGSTFVVTLDTGGEVTLTAAGTTIGSTLTGTYTVPSGVTTSDLKVSSFTTGTVTDVYGNTMNESTIPTGQNLSNNAAITIDTTPPTYAITSVSYNNTSGVLTFTGTAFDSLGVSNGGSMTSIIDWTKFSWDVDHGDTTTSPAVADISIAASDVSSATLVSATSFTVTLTSAAKSTLEGKTGFAAQGGSGNSDAADAIDITAGFLKDTAGNLVADGSDSDSTGDDQADNVTLGYNDTTRPTVESFTSTTEDGSYGVGDPINITATMSEAVIAGSTFDVTLGTGGAVTLTADANDATGKTLIGTYTVPQNVSTADLSISSFAAGTVTDVYGNAMTSTTIPAGQNLSNNSAIVIDTQPPTATVTSAAYNVSTGAITLTGANFDTLGVSNGGSVKSYLDFDGSKLSWDIDGDGTTADFAITAARVDTAVVTNATTLTVTLTTTAKTDLAATANFGAKGGADTIDVFQGFIKDKAGNTATTDAKANAAITYSDATRPSVQEFTSTTANGSYKATDPINITAKMTETVLAGAKITVTLGTNDTVELTTTSDSDTLSGTYTVGAGDTSADLNIGSYALGSGSNVVQDIYGNEANSTALPSGENLADNQAIVVDTTVPTATINNATYNGAGGTAKDKGIITITGENFNTIGVATGGDAKAYLNWDNIYWDIDGDSTSAQSSDFALASSDIASAIVTNDTTLTVTLTSSAKSNLEATSNFAASGTATADKIDVAAGFILDAAGNAATTDAKANAAITYSDATAPKVASFSSTTDDATYGIGSAINVTATMTETVQAGSTFDVTLSTTDVVTLTATTNGTTLTSTYSSNDYVVGTGDSSADLTVSSFTVGSVKDVYGNTMTNTSIPNGQNLANNADIVIDTVPVLANGRPVLDDLNLNSAADAGETIKLNFSEAVINLTEVAGQFSSATANNNGAFGSTLWSNSNKTLTITLDTNESYDANETITIEDVKDGGNNVEDITFLSVS